ncbi:DUF1007 family protein [Roseovarius sp. A21]|uniref:DUF1007 family protein n=1 Tax=Roseovarius bejariae TaxID=2576383 RepID=A0A844CIF6_9RHOB|nr:DUF1007 family protein [Roseovarius bejariae]MRU14462.1 DUF1007 family protein [Roseovarius bejariae]
MLRKLLILLALIPATIASAHPHVFVDVSLRFLSDTKGRLTGVEVTWSYDDFFSLLVLEDRGLDPDGDMQLTEKEQAALMGFDLEYWEPGFEGALFLYDEGEKVALGGPKATHATMEGGRIVTRHIRPVEALAPMHLTVRPYDPSYYAALDLVEVTGLPEICETELIQPDTDAADQKVETLGGVGMEAVYDEVQVGIYYADELRVTCAPSS